MTIDGNLESFGKELIIKRSTVNIGHQRRKEFIIRGWRNETSNKQVGAGSAGDRRAVVDVLDWRVIRVAF